MSRTAGVIVVVIIIILLVLSIKCTDNFSNQDILQMIPRKFKYIGCFNKEIFKSLSYNTIKINEISNKIENNSVFIINSIDIDGNISFWTGDENILIDLLVNSNIPFEELDNNNNKCYRYKLENSEITNSSNSNIIIDINVGSPKDAPTQTLAIYSNNNIKFINKIKNDKYKLLQSRIDNYKCPIQSCPTYTESSTKPISQSCSTISPKPYIKSNYDEKSELYKYMDCYKMDNPTGSIKYTSDDNTKVDIQYCADKSTSNNKKYFGLIDNNSCWIADNIDPVLQNSNACSVNGNYCIGKDSGVAVYSNDSWVKNPLIQ